MEHGANDNDINLSRAPIDKLPAPFGHETRAVKCPDGITRLLTYPKHIWKWHDYFMATKPFANSFNAEVAMWWRFTKDRFPDQLDKWFHQTFYYSIISMYRIHNGITKC